MVGDMYNLFVEIWSEQGFISLILEGDIFVEGWIVDCLMGNWVVKIIVGFGVGVGLIVIDVCFKDVVIGEVFVGFYYCVVSGISWLMIGSKFYKWVKKFVKEFVGGFQFVYDCGD